MAKKNLPKNIKVPTKLEGYDNLLSDIKSILQKGLSRAYQAVDNLKVQTYSIANKVFVFLQKNLQTFLAVGYANYANYFFSN